MTIRESILKAAPSSNRSRAVLLQPAKRFTTVLHLYARLSMVLGQSKFLVDKISEGMPRLQTLKTETREDVGSRKKIADAPEAAGQDIAAAEGEEERGKKFEMRERPLRASEDKPANVAVEDEPPEDTTMDSNYTLGQRVLVQSNPITLSLLSPGMKSVKKVVDPPSVVRQRMFDDEERHQIAWPDDDFEPGRILDILLHEREDKRGTISAVDRRKSPQATDSKETSQLCVCTIAGCGASSRLSDRELKSWTALSLEDGIGVLGAVGCIR